MNRYLLVVAVEQSKEAGLSTSGSLDTAEAKVLSSACEVAEIPK